MLNYRLAGHKTQIRTKHSNHFSQVKLPTIDKKHSEQEKQSLSKIKSGKLPLLNFGVVQLAHRNPIQSSISISEKWELYLSWNSTLIISLMLMRM